MVVSDIDVFCSNQTELQKGDVLEEIDGHRLDSLNAQTLRQLQITTMNGTREAIVVRESMETTKNDQASSQGVIRPQVNALERKDVPDVSLDSLPTSFSFYIDDKESEETANANTKRLGSAKKKTAPKKAKATQKRRARSAHLPKGWTEEVHKRSGSKTITYKYFFSPEQRYKFRSKKGVLKFLGALGETSGNEVEAYKLIKNSIR